MDRKDIERLAKIETKIDHIQETNSEIREILNEKKDKQVEYVRHDNSSYFYRNMSRYSADSLQKKVGWITYIDLLWKATVIGISGSFIWHWLRLGS